MKKIFLCLLATVSLISISFTFVKADNVTTVELVNGVKIRTDGNNGLKWVANVTNHNEGNIYGFVFAQGEVDDLTIETPGVINQVVNGLSDNNSFCATMVKFPTSAVAQDISVKAYVKVGDEYTYSDNTVVRNLAEVALAVYDATSSKKFVNNVVEYVDQNYKSLYVGFDGAISVSSAKYETNPVKLEEEFVKDWNALFGTSWTEFNYDTFNISAIDGSTPLTANADTNCAGTNAYTFFNSNEKTSTKWSWLLEFFLGETATGIHPKLQINALLSETGEYTLISGTSTYTQLWQFKHLSRALHNFFKAGSENINDWPSISFNNSNAFMQIGKYNDQVIASMPILVKIGEEVDLNTINKDGYNFDGYLDSNSDVSNSIIITNDDVSLTPQFSAVNYSITFMNGNEEFTDLAMKYNVEEYFYLPTPEITGYDFMGWYNNPDFTGDPIEMISAGTTGDKVFYAKYEVQDYVKVNVTFDLNGGYYGYASHAELVTDFLTDAGNLLGVTLSTPADYHANGNKSTVWRLSNTEFRNKWLWMMQYIKDMHIKQAIDTQYVDIILEGSSLSGYATQNVVLVLLGTNYATAIAATDSGGYGLSGFASKFTCSDFTSQTEGWWNEYFDEPTYLQDPTTLPVVYRENYDFVGWKSSLDNTIVTEFSGYKTTTADITYTAEWDSALGKEVTSLMISKYNTSENDYFDTSTNIYKSNIFINDSSTYFGVLFSNRIYIGLDSETGLQKVLKIVPSGTSGGWPTGASYCIVVPSDYSGTYDDNFDFSSVSVGNLVLFDKDVTKASTSNVVTMSIYQGYVEEEPEEVNASVTFDYDGGITEELYLSNGTSLGSLIASKYNATDYWNSSAPYKTNIYINTKSTTPGALFSDRIYIGKDSATGLYKVVKIVLSGVSNSVWPEEAEVCITIANAYSGTYDDNFKVGNIAVGNVILFDKAFTTASESNLVTFTFYSNNISNDVKTETITVDSKLPTPKKLGCSFLGWYDSKGNLYDEVSDFAGISSIIVTANWKYGDKIIGSFENNSWVEINNEIQLNYEFASGVALPVSWKSETPNIAEVDQNGLVTGLAEGVATIVVYVTDNSSVSFTYYVTVVNDASGMLKVLLDSNNEEIFTRYNLGVGSGTPAYYSDIIGSVSQLLFVDYVEHKDYYIAEPTKTYDLNGDASTNGIDFVTFHYAADMPQGGNAYLTGGKNLAGYNYTADNVSFHYSTGMDGIYYCQNVAWGAWHAGTSKSMKWYDSGLTTSDIGTDIYTTDVTLGSDGYFYIKGVKSDIQNTTGYTKLNAMGLAVKLEGTKWYLGGCYYNSTYALISSLGGNTNSIGIESSVREKSDLWLTWQYSAQLCAKLLIQFNLPMQRLVGHHFFSGKDCPQPLLENDLEIWYEFFEMSRQQRLYYEAYGSCGAAPTLTTSSSYIDSNGRITCLPTYTTCQTYTLTYQDGSSTKTITLSTIIPGSVA